MEKAGEAKQEVFYVHRYLILHLLQILHGQNGKTKRKTRLTLRCFIMISLLLAVLLGFTTRLLKTCGKYTELSKTEHFQPFFFSI